MIFKIELDYEARKIIQELTPEHYEELRNKIIGFPATQKDFWPGDFIVDEEGVRYLITLCKGVKIKQWGNTYSAQKPESGWAQEIDNFKNAVHVHVPNIGLLMINQVCVLEDACTERLQEYLDADWKILAVCPPNGVRRPDYILGSIVKKEV